MLLGYNTNGLAHHRLDEAIELLADEGYRAIALTLDVPHLDPMRSGPGEIAAVAAALQRTGLTCVIETGARFVLDPRRKHRPNLLEADASERKVRVDFLRRCLEIGSELGAVALSFWAGQRPDRVDVQTAWDHLVAGIESLLPDADQHGVPLALEPEPGMLIETVAEGIAVLDRIGSPHAGLTVDIGHLFVTGEGEPAEVLPSARGRILQVHVEDIRRGVHEHLPPGDGDVDFTAVWDALAGVEYRGPVCFELSRSSYAAPEMLRLAKRAFLCRREE